MMWQGNSVPQWASWAFQGQGSQNSNNGEVDWAALAKQWITMKENPDVSVPHPGFAGLQVPLPPLPPSVSDVAVAQKIQPPLPPPPPPPPDFRPASDPVGGDTGEMDMEIEEDKEVVQHNSQQNKNGQNWPNQNWANNSAPNWNPPGQEDRGWNVGWPMDPSHASTAVQEVKEVSNPPYMPAHYQVDPSMEHHPNAFHQGPDYGWNQQSAPVPPAGMHKVVDYNHQDKRRPRHAPHIDPPMVKDDVQLDAAQRKKLPTWIRQGLEKMEKEKVKKLEREQMLSTQEELLRQKREAEARAKLALKEGLDNDGIPMQPIKSKFDSDQEESEEDVEEPARKKRFSPPEEPSPKNVPIQNTQTFKVFKSEEEAAADMLKKIRRWMTEVLLDVTTNMILEVATEVYNKEKSREPQVKKNSAFSSGSGGLGLSMYEDSDSGSEADEPKQPKADLESDSEDELRRSIRKKRRDFENVERSILQRLQKEEEAKIAKKTEQSSPPEVVSEAPSPAPQEEPNPAASTQKENPSIAPPANSDSTTMLPSNGQTESTRSSSTSTDSSSESSVEERKKKKKKKDRHSSVERSHKSRKKGHKKLSSDHSKKSKKADRDRSRSVSTHRRKKRSRSRSVSPQKSKRRSRSRSVSSHRPKKRSRSRSVSSYRRRRVSRSRSTSYRNRRKRYTRSRSTSRRRRVSRSRSPVKYRRRSRSRSPVRRRHYDDRRSRYRSGRSRTPDRKSSRVGRSRRSSS